ncbi:HPr family phosphocarrier protein [Nocardiopsis sp. RSe5-2]|uniref:Phosphocarrier protein HPr n=1 Tax=Nocardiopsis endophytica TaxID=3018445 RepID=A0ABT4TZX2_9ACTN|nr:HPr family phosphocarrier protein [Nocardiopsis endophytica]MDA2810254.1 HPr family phosphocarrier protein [Nocardiopsis endophytica]
MAERRVKVESEVGLHARPAALFVEAASKAPGEATVAKGDGAPVSAKSILAVMGLDVRHGDEITIRVDGEDADTVLDRLAEIAGAA